MKSKMPKFQLPLKEFTIKNLLIIIFFSTFSSLGFSKTVVTATVLNSSTKFVNLTYMGSCSVASPNYFGDKRICGQISNNEFKFVFNTDPEYSLYLLEFVGNQEAIQLLIKEGDSIHISYDFRNKIKTFLASGKGASITNYLFAENILRPENIPEMRPEEIIPFWKNLQMTKLTLIECFKTKRLTNINSLSIDEKNSLERLIMNSKLTLDQCKLLENRTYYYIALAISRTPFNYLIKNLDNYLKLYSNIDLTNKFILNDYVTDDLTGCYVSLKCYKECIEKTKSYDLDNLYKYSADNFFNIAKKVLKGKALEKYLCDNVYNYMIDGNYGKYDELYLANMNIFIDKHYIKKINDFYSNYLSALNNPDFNLGLPGKVLNDSTVYSLLDSFKGHKVYLIIWKVGSGCSYSLSPLYEIQTIKYLTRIYEPLSIKFLNICLDDRTLKQHWASSVVNHDWHGEHYFYIGSDSSSFRQMLGIVGSFKSCNGEKYFLLDESGKIVKNNKSDLIIEIE